MKKRWGLSEKNPPLPRRNNLPPLPERRTMIQLSDEMLPPLPKRNNSSKRPIMGDWFWSAMTVNLLNVKKSVIIPNHIVIELSFDMIPDFIKTIDLMDTDKILMISSVILYDERDKINDTDMEYIIGFIRTIKNKLGSKNSILTLKLSDMMVGIYNRIMYEELNGMDKRTYMHMTINRHPVVDCDRDDMNMSLSLGGNNFDIQNLMMLSDNDLYYLYEKHFISESLYKSAISLKIVVVDFNNYLEDNYYVDKLNEFHKVMVVYEWMREHISYASEATYYEDGVQKLILGTEESTWVSDPYMTYIRCRGVCSGQAKLMSVLLNRSILKVNSVVLEGKQGKTNHVWIGIIINNKLYQCCITMNKPLMDLENRSYVISEADLFHRVYPFGSLNQEQIDSIKTDIKPGGCLRKKNYIRVKDKKDEKE